MLHEWAKLCANVPPHASSWALGISRPPTTCVVSTGKLSLSLTTFSSSAATVVTTLKDEPGGWGAENARPDTPSTDPCLASSTATPPKRPASPR